MKILLGNKTIGAKEDVFIIAEAANNHNGDFKIAKEMIQAAAKTGADAIKFQCFYADSFAVKEHPYYDVYKKLEFTKEQWIELFETAKKNNLAFIVDVNDKKSVNMIDSIGVPMFKIHTGDLLNPLFLRYVAKKGKPMILHAGLVEMPELKKAASIIKASGNDKIIPMHGWQDYPTKPEQLNLNVIKVFVKEFGIAAFADHTTDIIAPIAAVALGAKIIEKHFSLNRSLKNYDWESAVEPNEFSKMVNMIRKIEKMLGSDNLILSVEQKKHLDTIRKHVVARRFIRKGEIIKEEMFAYKRSPKGIYPTDVDKLIGKKAKEDIEIDEPITFGKVEG